MTTPSALDIVLDIPPHLETTFFDDAMAERLRPGSPRHRASRTGKRLASAATNPGYPQRALPEFAKPPGVGIAVTRIAAS